MYLNDGSNESDVGMYRGIPLERTGNVSYRSRRMSGGKILFIVVAVCLFSMWGLSLLGSSGIANTDLQSTAVPTIERPQAVIDAIQLDAAEDQALLNSMAHNTHINAVNDVSLQATRMFIPVRATQAIADIKIREYEHQAQANIALDNAAIANKIAWEKEQADIYIKRQESIAEIALMLSASTALFLIAVGVTVAIVRWSKSIEPAKAAEAETSPVIPLVLPANPPHKDDAAMRELFSLIRELDENRRETGVITNNYGNYSRNSPKFDDRVALHANLLREVGQLNDEQIASLPLKAAQMKDGVPEYAAVAIRRLRDINPETGKPYMKRGIVTNIFGMAGTNSKYYDEVMS